MGITKERTQIQALCSIGRGKVSKRLKEQRLFSAYFYSAIRPRIAQQLSYRFLMNLKGQMSLIKFKVSLLLLSFLPVPDQRRYNVCKEKE